jgi:hypothetical protein
VTGGRGRAPSRLRHYGQLLLPNIKEWSISVMAELVQQVIGYPLNRRPLTQKIDCGLSGLLSAFRQLIVASRCRGVK